MPRGMLRPLALSFLVGSLCLQPAPSLALISVGKGNRPVKGLSLPTGAEAVANLPSRLGHTAGPAAGEYHFQYHCQSTVDFNKALKQFGAIRVPRTARASTASIDGQRVRTMEGKPLLLVVHDGPKDRSDRYGVDFGKRVDWTFTIWSPESFHRQFSRPEGWFFSNHPHYRQPVPPPRIDVYVDGGGPIAWDEVSVPPNVRVIDKRKSASTHAHDGGVVRGRVFSMATHQVIAGAEITLRKRAERRQWQDVRQTVTDETGAFEMPAIAEGYYRIYVRKEGCAGRSAAAFDNATGHACLELDVLLSREVSLKGTVTDEEGHPINGVEVRTSTILGIDGLGYQCADRPSATSDEQGRFELSLLPEGFATVSARSPGMHQIRIEPDKALFELSTKSWTDRQNKEIRIIMGGTGGVYGRVLGMDGLPPTRKFTVELIPEGGHKVGSWGGAMRCREGGKFEFKGVPPGTYELVAQPNPGSKREATTPQKVSIQAGKACQIEIRSAHAR